MNIKQDRWKNEYISSECMLVLSLLLFCVMEFDILKWMLLPSLFGATQMLKKLSKQLSGEDWNWNNLNTLCWAIGSISGSMMEEQVNTFSGPMEP